MMSSLRLGWLASIYDTSDGAPGCPIAASIDYSLEATGLTSRPSLSDWAWSVRPLRPRLRRPACRHRVRG